MRVPEVLLSGDHAKVEAWRREQAERMTRERRPDLWAEYRKDSEPGG
jgi:tRNA (guanine37-N1)-methyltransferase